MPQGPHEIMLAAPARDGWVPPPGDGGGDFGSDGEGGIDFRRYLAAVIRQKWLILALGVLGFGAGVGASRIIKPSFDAQATIQIEGSGSAAVNQTSPIRNTPMLESRGWLELLRSFTVLDEVVRRRRLFVEVSASENRDLFAEFELASEFTPGDYRLQVDAAGSRVQLSNAKGTVVDDAALGDSIGRSLGFLWRPARLMAGQDVRFTVRVPRDAAVRLSQRLNTQLPTEGAVIRIELRGTDPSEIAATVNSIAERFVEVATLMKRENLTTRTTVLREQLASSRLDLVAAENALESFKVTTITMPVDRGASPIASGLTVTQDPVRQAFFRLRLDRDSLAQERDAIRTTLLKRQDPERSILIELGTIFSVRTATELSAALNELATKRAEARQLRLVFSSTHPDLAKLEREIELLETRTVPDQARALADNLDSRVADLDARIAGSAREMQQIPARVTEEARLQRNVQLNETIFSQLQSAYESARLAELSAAPDVRLLDRAVTPTQPVTDTILVVIAGGLAGGLALGILLSLLIDRFDRRLRYPEQVSQELGLSILGAIPMVEYDRGGKAKPEQAAQLLEAMRTIRLNLGYAHGAAGTLITTITSPGAGDGKSFVSANLARAYATAGRRTLLIDADSRRGLQHRMLKVDRKPGLLDFLSGTATREQVIRSVPDWGIDFIPCGTRMAGGPELLSSPQMAQLILGLRADYQVMLIDSPPIGAGVDPLVLASLCGSLVMVLRTGVTDRELAESRLHELDRLPIRVLGAVINDVQAKGIYKYYAYLPGYRAEDEEHDEETRAPKRRLLGLG